MMKLIAIFVSLTLSLCACAAAIAEDFAVTDVPAVGQSNTLVVYFSCTGTTEAVAQLIAEATGADIYAIQPETPYTSEDLDYGNDNSRANQEMNDPAARPAIGSEPIAGMEAYEVLYLGYPIWWGEAPRIISTFMESYELGGKTIVPFCTSGSSGIGGSLSGIRELAPEATVLDGARLNNATAQSVGEWLASLKLDGVDDQ